MSKNELVDALLEFQQTLSRSHDLGESERAELLATLEAIQEDLEREQEGASDGSLVGRLRAAIEGFEESHPRLTEVVGRVADSLADLGI